MSSPRRVGVVLGSSVLLGLMAGCAPKKPIVLHPEFHQQEIRSVSLMPVVDRRPERSTRLDFDGDLRSRARKALEKKGYSVTLPDSFGDLQADEIAESSYEELANLGPEDADAMVIVFLDDAKSDYKVLYYTFQIETTATMIGRRNRTELWRAKGVGASGQGGLISGLTQGIDRWTAIDTCIGQLFGSLPRRDAQ